jgi:PDZ domain
MSRASTTTASLLSACVAALFAQGLRGAPEGIAIQGKFDTATEHVLIPVTISGHDFWCNPDSGFSALVALDASKAAAAGLAVSPGIQTPDGNAPSRSDNSTATTMVVGGVTFSNQPIILRRFPEEAPDMDCIMGVALLRRFVVEFDHMMPQLILHDRAAYRPPAGAETIPLLFRTNPRVPYLDIHMTLRDGAHLPLRVLPDTGASFYGAVLVGDAMTRAQSALPSARAVTYPDPQTGRITELRVARPRAVAVGSFTMSEPVIAFVQGSLGGDGAIGDGVLGSGFLRRFTVAFDFDGRKMYLKPNERLAQPHAFDASGVAFIRRNSRHAVYEVIPDSVGAKAGVRAGDVLTEIDGRPASDLTPVQLRALLSADGTTRRLILERDGRIVTCVLQLKARI